MIYLSDIPCTSAATLRNSGSTGRPGGTAAAYCWTDPLLQSGPRALGYTTSRTGPDQAPGPHS